MTTRSPPRRDGHGGVDARAPLFEQERRQSGAGGRGILGGTLSSGMRREEPPQCRRKGRRPQSVCFCKISAMKSADFESGRDSG